MRLFTAAKIRMILAEFMCAGLLTTAALTLGSSDVATAYFVAAGVGVMLALNAVMFGGVSASLGNSAITVGLLSIGKMRFEKALVFIAAQVVGAVAALRLNLWLTDGPAVTFRFDSINWRVFVAEVLGAAVFAKVVYTVVKKGYSTIAQAGALGAALFLGIMLASVVPASLESRAKDRSAPSHYEGVINPAVALGTQNFGWEYILGPVVGAVVGMNVYGYVYGDRVVRLNRVSRPHVTTTIVSKKAKKTLKNKR